MDRFYLGLLFLTNLFMNFSQLILFLFHCFVSLQYGHSWKFVDFIWTKVIRKISYLSQEVFINLISFNLLSNIFELVLFVFSFFLLVKNLFFSLLISFLKLSELFKVILFFSIISENLLFLVFELLGGFELFFHKFLSFQWKFSECIFHVSFLVLILSFNLSLLLLYFKKLCVLRLSLKTNCITRDDYFIQVFFFVSL